MSHPARHLPGERLVAFVDILGFKAIVDGMTDPAKRPSFEDIRGMLEYTRGLLNHFKVISVANSGKGFVDSLRGIEMTHFSDSIVLSLPVEPDRLPSQITGLTSAFSLLTCDLLEKGVAIRGGLAIGWLFHDDDTVIGDGMNRAYQLESEIAKVPRIVVDDEIISRLPQRASLFGMRRDSDGFWFIEIFRCLFEPNLIRHKWLPIRTQIVRSLENPSPSVKAKYRWLAFQFNATLGDVRSRLPHLAEHLPEPIEY